MSADMTECPHGAVDEEILLCPPCQAADPAAKARRAQPATESVFASRRPVLAQFETDCAGEDCRLSIEPGDEIAEVDGYWHHARCAS